MRFQGDNYGYLQEFMRKIWKNLDIYENKHFHLLKKIVYLLYTRDWVSPLHIYYKNTSIGGSTETY